jgi:predicted DsbA family dithiol-disulfide isomerase
MGYNEDVEHFNKDKRAIVDNKRNAKYEDKQIYDYYKEKVNKHYETHHKKLKDTEILPEIIDVFGLSAIQFKRIKKKYKES